MSLTGYAAGLSAARGSLAALAPVFGYANVVALSPTGIQAAQGEYIAGSAVQVQASYFDINGNPMMPAGVKWALMAITGSLTDCCIELTPWVAIAPALTNTITVPAAKNIMFSWTRPYEQHAVIFQIIDVQGDVNYAQVLFTVRRVCGAPLTIAIQGWAVSAPVATGVLG